MTLPRHLLSAADLSRDDALLLLDTAEELARVADRPIKKLPTLRGRTVVNLFFEDSTRTRTSFEVAAKRLSADVINFSAQGSSVSKGESLKDTALTLEAMGADGVVVRHSASGAPHRLANWIRGSVVNAGDGTHEHPTQALLDAYTIRQRLGRLEGVRVAIVGDVLHSRVARSNVGLLHTLGAEVAVVAPPTLLPVGIGSWPVEVSYDLDAVLPKADVVMMLRVQAERMNASYFPSAREYSRRYGLDATRMAALPDEAIVMHPGPMNRGMEIAAEVADSVRSTIVEQVANGVSVRMAVLYLRLGQQAGLVDVVPVGAVTVGLRGERLAELGAMAESAARVRVFSDDGQCVADPALMRRALEYVKAFDGVVAQHAEEPRLTVGAQMNEGDRSARLGLAGWPAAAEESIIARDVLLAGHVGARLHVCHVSTAGSVELLRWAKGRGVQVTAEVTPHHLLLTDACAEGYDPVFKVNPPLRTDDDVAAVRQGLADGTIDAVATDHAPHAVEDKESEWAQARPGMPGLEQALSVVLQTMVEPGLLDWRGVADRMSVRPAGIGRLGAHGRPLAAGEPANLLLLDPGVRAVVDPAGLASRSRNSPYAGRELPGRVVHTFPSGEAAGL